MWGPKMYGAPAKRVFIYAVRKNSAVSCRYHVNISWLLPKYSAGYKRGFRFSDADGFGATLAEALSEALADYRAQRMQGC